MERTVIAATTGMDFQRRVDDCLSQSGTWWLYSRITGVFNVKDGSCAASISQRCSLSVIIGACSCKVVRSIFSRLILFGSDGRICRIFSSVLFIYVWHERSEVKVL